MNDVYVTRTGSFLPFDPVRNEDIEAVLGVAADQPSRVRAYILRSNGIESRYYAIDRRTGKTAFTNAKLTAQAVHALGDVVDVDVLACGTSQADQLMPGHASMVHGELGWPALEAVSCAGICLSGIAAMKHAWLAVRAGVANRAVATGSELVSMVIRGNLFKPELEQLRAVDASPEVAFDKDFLRWMLSDGAGAVLLEKEPPAKVMNSAACSALRVEWIELSSAAGQLPACMYSGAEKNADGSLKSWADFHPDEWATRSVFAIKQDVRLLNQNIVRVTIGEHLAALVKKYDLRPDAIDWFLPHFSSYYFAPRVEEWLAKIGIPIPRERWFTNLSTKGNTGAAFPYIVLDELFRSGRVQPGEKLLMLIPESGRFSSGYVCMTAV